MSTMKALVKKYDKEGLWLDEVPVPDPGINDVKIKIKKTLWVYLYISGN